MWFYVCRGENVIQFGRSTRQTLSDRKDVKMLYTSAASFVILGSVAKAGRTHLEAGFIRPGLSQHI